MRSFRKFSLAGLLALLSVGGCWPSGSIPCAVSAECAAPGGPLGDDGKEASFCGTTAQGSDLFCSPILCTVGATSTKAPPGSVCIPLENSPAVQHLFALSGTNGYDGYYAKQACSLTQACPAATECQYGFCQPTTPVKG